MADLTRPDFGEAWASEGEKLSPDSVKIKLGWVQEMMPYQFQNFLQSRQDEAILYLLQKGVPEYSPTQEYTANKSVVVYQGNLYMATSTVTGVLPTVAASWKRVSPTTGANGAVIISSGGTGATTVAEARTNLGLGTASTANLPSTNGVVVRSADNTLISRILTGTSGNISITNPDGVAGNININVGTNVAQLDKDSSWTSKGGITLPKGSSGDRGVEVAGKIRYNTELQKFEGFDGTSWNALGAASEVEITTLSGDGITTSFTLNTPAFSESSTDVYIGGVYQNKGTYSVSGAVITFYEAPTPGTDNIQVVSRRVVDLGIARASQVSIEDAANKYTATTVEGALREITEYEGEIEAEASWDDVPKHKSAAFNTQAQALANRTALLKSRTDKSVLSYPDYAAASAAAATLPDGQNVVDASSQIEYQVSGGALQRVSSLPTKGFVFGDTAKFQAALNDTSNRQVKFEPGSYDFDGQTFTVFNKNHNVRYGEYIIDLTGVEFKGSGTIIIDSCKRLKIKGLFAPNWDIDIRGLWWGCFEDCMYRRTYTGRAGTIFSDSYWNQWFGGVTQAVVIPADAVAPSNAYMWHNHSMRGNAQQGFSGTETHAFHFLGNQNAQQWIFSGDISYHTVDVINAPDTNTADIELDFNVYWDSVIPVLNSRPNVRLRNRGHHANGTGTFLPWQQALKTHVDVTRRDRILLNTPGSVRNMVLNGDFSEQMASWTGANQPFHTVSGATITWASGGLSGGYLQVSQPATTNNAIVAVGRNKQFAGTYTVVWVVRNRDAGERTIRASIGSPTGLNYVTAKINDTEPTVITLSTSNIPGGSGTVVSSLFADGSGFNVDILYVGICPGITTPLLLPQERRREIRGDFVSAGVTVPANGFFIESFTLSGAAVGDKVDASVSTGSLWVEARVTGANTVQVKYSSTSASSFDTTGLNVYLTLRKRLLGS